jgi:hypothetical protein
LDFSVHGQVGVRQGGAAGSKETEDDALPLWDIAHAEKSETTLVGCVASCEKDGKMDGEKSDRIERQTRKKKSRTYACLNAGRLRLP